MGKLTIDSVVSEITKIKELGSRVTRDLLVQRLAKKYVVTYDVVINVIEESVKEGKIKLVENMFYKLVEEKKNV